MRITSKGQVTIPAKIREQAGLMPHTEVDIVMDGETVLIVPTRSAATRETRGEKIVRNMKKHSGGQGMTTEEIMKLMRGDDWPDLR